MKKYKVLQNNSIIQRLLAVFLVMTVLIGIIACYYACQSKRAELMADLEQQLFYVAEEYKDIVEEFWELYLPIYEEEDTLLAKYFESEEPLFFSSIQQFELREMLSQMAHRNEKVDWIALYSPNQTTNYIYFTDKDVIQSLTDGLPYLERLDSKKQRMDIYPVREVRFGDQYFGNNLIIAGGAPGYNNKGSIVVGYNISHLEELCKKNSDFASLQFNVLCEGEVIFASDSEMAWGIWEEELSNGGVFEMEGEQWYSQVSGQQVRGGTIFYAVRWHEMLGAISRSIVMILVIVVLMMTLAVLMYVLALRSITKEVNTIRRGLIKLGKNELDHQIEETFAQPELVVIAREINKMAFSLKENIERAREYERRHKQAELQELQAKFNPHFLYNTLEMFRLRCYQNGDEETADLIAQTATIFRGIIGSRTFVPIKEELAFSKRYLALFFARYGESVKVSYDIDTEVLQYGIIRTAFQPLIENYFEHGYNPSGKQNEFIIRGCSRDEETILFTIEDNGFGITSEKREELNDMLGRPIVYGEESYGLKNLHQRLRLFYGEGCGLTISTNQNAGFVIEMTIKKWKYGDV